MRDHLLQPLALISGAFILWNVVAWGQSVTVDVHQVVAQHPENPIGYCANFLGDSDRLGERKRSMADVLRAAGGGTYRWPAGTIAENYLWHPPGEYETAVNGLRPRPVSHGKFSWKPLLAPDGSFLNAMDFDEFVATCKAAHADPIVMVSSYGWKLPGASVTREELITSAREWVRYANVTRGHGVRYWEIGNEVDLKKCPLTLDEYLDYYEDVVDAMKGIDPTIKTGLGLLRGSAEDYYKAAFERFPEKIDFCVAHQYHTYLKNFPMYSRHDDNYIKSIDAALTNIDRFAPPDRAPTVEVLVTEFSAFSPQRRWVDSEPSVYKALLSFEMIGNALTRDSRVRALNFWITHNPWNRTKITDANALFPDNTPTAMGKIVELMGSNLRPQMVQAPRVAGDLRTYATFDPTCGGLTVFLLNKSPEIRTATVTLAGYNGTKNTVSVFQGDPDPTANNFTLTIAPPADVQAAKFHYPLPPGSITTIVFQN